MHGKQHAACVSLLLVVTVDFRSYVKVHGIDAGYQIRPNRAVGRTRLCTNKVLLMLLIYCVARFEM